MKHGILRELNKRDCDVIVVPYNTSAEEILALHPDGIMLSNGPGNPEDVEGAVDTVKDLIGKVPIFGICLVTNYFLLHVVQESVKLKLVTEVEITR